MPEYLYLLTLALFLGTILAVFGMKYFSAMRQAQSRILAENAYRELAQKAVSAQSENASWLSKMQTQLSELNARMAAVEKILKAVE